MTKIVILTQKCSLSNLKLLDLYVYIGSGRFLLSHETTKQTLQPCCIQNACHHLSTKPWWGFFWLYVYQISNWLNLFSCFATTCLIMKVCVHLRLLSSHPLIWQTVVDPLSPPYSLMCIKTGSGCILSRAEEGCRLLIGHQQSRSALTVFAWVIILF